MTEPNQSPTKDGNTATSNEHDVFEGGFGGVIGGGFDDTFEIQC